MDLTLGLIPASLGKQRGERAMAQFQELTVTFKYIDGEEFQQWFKEQINSRICCVKGNENKQIQVTAWALYDALEKLEQYETEPNINPIPIEGGRIDD